MSLVTEDVIINFSPVFKRLEKLGRKVRCKVRPWVVAEKQHNEMSSVATFALSRKHLVMKGFVLKIVFLKKGFSSRFLENTMKMSWDRKGIMKKCN